MIRLLVLFFLTMCLLSQGYAIDLYRDVGSPDLIAISSDAVLSPGDVGVVRVGIQNNGSLTNLSPIRQPESHDEAALAVIEAGYEMNSTRAVGVRAQLRSSDPMIEVLSGPRLLGTLNSGSSASIQFDVSTDPSTAIGTYPLELLVGYKRPANVEVSGNPDFPDISFIYENDSKLIPVEVRVVYGPRLFLQEVEGVACIGKSSQIELIFFNAGGARAREVSAYPRSEYPLSYNGPPARIGEIAPGGTARARFKINVSQDAQNGYYVLPVSLQYSSFQPNKTLSLAAVVPVGPFRPAFGPYVLIAFAFLLGVMLIAIVLQRRAIRKGGISVRLKKRL